MSIPWAVITFMDSYKGILPWRLGLGLTVFFCTENFHGVLQRHKNDASREPLGFSFSSELALGDSDSTQPFSPSSVPDFISSAVSLVLSVPSNCSLLALGDSDSTQPFCLDFFLVNSASPLVDGAPISSNSVASDSRFPFSLQTLLRHWLMVLQFHRIQWLWFLFLRMMWLKNHKVWSLLWISSFRKDFLGLEILSDSIIAPSAVSLGFWFSFVCCAVASIQDGKAIETSLSLSFRCTRFCWSLLFVRHLRREEMLSTKSIVFALLDRNKQRCKSDILYRGSCVSVSVTDPTGASFVILFHSAWFCVGSADFTSLDFATEPRICLRSSPCLILIFVSVWRWFE